MRIFRFEPRSQPASPWPILPALAPYALALLVLFVATSLSDAPVARLPITRVQLLDAAGAPIDVDPRTMSVPSGLATLDVVFTSRSPAAEPLGLYLSGLYSARASWNGVAIGAKGAPAAVPDGERFGPIDAVIPIPAQLVKPGDNVLRLELSAHGPRFGAHLLFHSVNGDYGFSVAPYSADQRRPIGRYLAPLVTAGFLSLALVVLAIRGMPARSTREKRLALLFIFALLVAAIAEISRAFIAYPYPYHGLRLFLITGASATVGLAVSLLAMEFAGSRLSRPRLYLAAAALALVALFLDGFDERAAFLIASGAAIGCGFALRGAYDGKSSSAEIALALSCIVAFAMFDPSSFLDCTLYAAAIPLVTRLVSFAAEPPAPIVAPVVIAAPEIAPQPQRLAIGGVGHRRYVALATIKAVHGAGNYAEFELATGQRILDDRSLSELAGLLPSGFFRAHRSHIVNLEQLASIVVLGPGKYAVEMLDKSRVPLSRNRVALLRSSLSPPAGSPIL